MNVIKNPIVKRGAVAPFRQPKASAAVLHIRESSTEVVEIDRAEGTGVLTCVPFRLTKERGGGLCCVVKPGRMQGGVIPAVSRGHVDVSSI